MAELKYKTGDATNPEEDGHKYIIHVTNTVGGFGAGFVLALKKKWPETEWYYRKAISECVENKTNPLGKIYSVPVETDITVVHMMAQVFLNVRYDKDGNKTIPLSYEALETCLDKVCELVLSSKEKACITAPRFGSGLAGASWERVEKLITKCLVDNGVDVTIYDLPMS